MQQMPMKKSHKKNLKINMRLVLTAFVLSLLMSACSKDDGCKSVPPSDEDAALVAYNTNHGYTMVKHANGMYYQILAPGSDSRPKSSSTIYVKYVGKKLDDTIFDQATNPGQTGFYLTQLIEAWQAGLPLIGKGGRILLTVPSSLGYSCQGSGASIPPNTPLFFDITLVEFN